MARLGSWRIYGLRRSRVCKLVGGRGAFFGDEGIVGRWRSVIGDRDAGRRFGWEKSGQGERGIGTGVGGLLYCSMYFPCPKWARQACPYWERLAIFSIENHRTRRSWKQNSGHARRSRFRNVFWAMKTVFQSAAFTFLVTVPRFGSPLCAPGKATAAWQWYNYTSSRDIGGREVLRLNLDETSVCLHQDPAKGNLFVTPRRLADRVPRWKRRRYMTHVGIVCDQSAIQPLLPQVLIGNEATFKVSELPALQARCPPNVVLLRRKTAWNNAVVCACIIRRLGAALAPHVGHYQPVLIMDAVRTHFTARVLRACAAAGIWVVFVPAKLTWLLQPLDVYSFQRYKAHLRAQYAAARCRSSTGDLTMLEFLECVYSAVRYVLQAIEWAPAFDKTGFGACQANVSRIIKGELENIGSVEALSTRPSDDQLAVCFPARARVPVALIWQPFDAPPIVHAAPSVPASSCSGAAVAIPEAQAARRPVTRSVSRLAAACTTEAPLAEAVAVTPVAPAPPLTASSSASSSASTSVVLGRTRAATRALAAARGAG